MAISGLIKWFDSLLFSYPSSQLGSPTSSASFRPVEETLALRLLSLLPVPCESPGTPILWLASALRVLSLTLSDAAAASSVAADSLDPDVGYLDSSVALLDACNAVSAEIARVEHRLLYLRLALCCLIPDEDGHDDDRPKSKLHCARKAVAEWENIPSREIGRSTGELIHRMAPRCVESAARCRVTYAAAEVSRLVMVAVVVALGGREGKSQIGEMRVSCDWPWAEAFDQIAAAISDRLGAALPLELAAVEAAAGTLARGIERGEVGDGVVATVGRAAEELAPALEKLRESVNGAFVSGGDRNQECVIEPPAGSLLELDYRLVIMALKLCLWCISLDIDHY